MTDAVNCKGKKFFLIFMDLIICNCIVHNNIIFINNVDYLLKFLIFTYKSKEVNVTRNSIDSTRKY